MNLRLGAVLTALAMLSAGQAGAQTTPEKPKLVVMIAVDQFAGGLFDAWRGRFTGGLKRLAGGVVYPQGYQSHANTETCPGHSTMLTGKYPNKTGIIGNNVREPETGKWVYCLKDSSVRLTLDPKAEAVGPAKLMATTLGDWLKAASPQSRVVAVSAKDRGAISLAGKKPDGVFWLLPGKGFTTYAARGESAKRKMAPIDAVNAATAKTWSTIPTWTYTHDECRALEASMTIGYDQFQMKLPPDLWGLSDDRDVIRNNVMVTPIPDDMTLQAARGFIKYFNLGRGPATDLLAVSFSATDYVGHRFGAQGPEMCEQLYRLDASIGVLLADLDALNVPYVVALTADHGGSDFTERLIARGYSASRVESEAMFARLNTALRKQFGLDADPMSGNVLEADVVAKFAAQRGAIAAAAAKILAAEPEIAGAYTQEDLLATSVPRGKAPDELTLKERFAQSTYAGRSSDVVAAFQPGGVLNQPNIRGTMAGHGSPWNYDRRVPILFWWKGAAGEERALPIETVDIAPTLANLVGVAPPADIDGRCLPLPGWTPCPAR